jgi:hypothetical protein
MIDVWEGKSEAEGRGERDKEREKEKGGERERERPERPLEWKKMTSPSANVIFPTSAHLSATKNVVSLTHTATSSPDTFTTNSCGHDWRSGVRERRKERRREGERERRREGERDCTPGRGRGLWWFAAREHMRCWHHHWDATQTEERNCTPDEKKEKER